MAQKNQQIEALLELERRDMQNPGTMPDELKAKLKAYRDQGVVKPLASDTGSKSSSTEGERKASAFLTRALGAAKSYEATGMGPRGYVAQTVRDIAPTASNYLASGERQVADSAQDEFIAATLRQDSGAAIPPAEMESQRRIYFPMPGDGPEVIEQKKQARIRALEGLVASAGGMVTDDTKKEFEQFKGPTAKGPALELKFNDEIAQPVGWKATPEQEQKLADFTRSAKSPDEIVAFARGLGVDIDRTDAEKVLNYSKENPDYVPGFDYKKAEEQAKAKAREELGGANNPANAAASGFADTATVGLADKLSAIGQTVFGGGTYGENLAANRAKSQVMAEDNPLSTLAGSVGGLIAGGEAGAMKFPGVARYLSEGSRAARFGKGIAADTLYGAGYGANKADNGDYIGGAMRGAGEAAIGSALGRGVVGAAGAALSPAANASVDFLRSKGVRTTPLQSLGPKGAVVEEKLTSVPVIGSMIGSAKDRASKDFQRAFINESLAPIGKEVTEEVSGTQLMAKAQQAFNDAYADARAGMRLVPDAELVDALSALDKRLADGEVSEDVYKRLRKIYDAQVGRRLKKGAIDGEDYKAMHSSLGKLMDTAKRSQNFELANGLNEMQAILDTAARKSSPAEAVAKMDAADQGYALFVRAENAAKMRGGDTGEFSARQLDSAVQKGDSSVRSKAYLRGDALGQDWAQAGKDILREGPNSWTAERLMTGGLLAGGTGLASAFNPVAAIPAGGLAAAYLPKVRDVASSVIAGKRPAQIRQAGDIMVNQARLGSAFTLPYFLSE